MYAIATEGLGKRYRLGEHAAGYQTLREAVGSLVTRRKESVASEEIWALKDIDLTLSDGDAVGLIGRNGAGKTTLLKVLARITEPTVGVARVSGRIGALLEVGTGFHPELTGRENVFLNGAVLGMTRRDVVRRFDEIVDFAGVEEFLDTPLKRYSTGMHLRLAFAVAAHLEPDILVVDEVLAVGDTEFQQRCLSKISEIGDEGRTVMFVSHDLGAVARLCPRIVWLDQGRIAADGAGEAVVGAYLETIPTRGGAGHVELPADENKPAQLRSIAVTPEQGEQSATIRRDVAFDITLRFSVRERTPGLDVSTWLINPRGTYVLYEAWSDTARPGEMLGSPGEYEASLTVPPLLPPGQYTVGAWIGTGTEDFFWDEVLTVHIQPSSGDRDEPISRNRVIQLPPSWRISTSAPLRT